MAGETRILQFSEGVSVGTPVTTNVTALGVQAFANDAAYVSAKGSAAANGDLYYNTTDNVVRFYKNTAWQDLLDEGELILTVNAGGDQATADGASGIEVSMSDATNARLIYDSSLTSRFKLGDSGSESEIVVVAGSQTISGLKDFSGVLTVSNATASTDASTGALVVTGGVGIGGDVNITGDLTVDGTTNTLNDLVVTDATITVNSGGTQATADSADAGLIVDMSDATNAAIGYDSTLASKFALGEVGSLSEIADVDSSQQLTNKDIDGGTASDTSRITLPKNTTSNLDGLTRKEGTLVYDTDLQTIKIDDGTNLNEISGGGGGGENFIDNNTFDVNADNWAAFADATDLDGGSPTVTFARTTSTPLQGAGSGLFTKDAANRVDEGFRGLATEIPDALHFQVITFSLDIETSSGYVDNDCEIVCYDVTNGELVQVLSGLYIKASANPQKHYAQVQIKDPASIRIGAKVTNTNTNAFTLKIDNVSFGRLAINTGPVVYNKEFDLVIRAGTTDPTPNLANSSFTYTRVGNYALINIFLQQTSAGSAGSGNYLLDLSDIGVIDESIVEPGTAVGNQLPRVGQGQFTSGGSLFNSYVTYDDGTGYLLVTHDERAASTQGIWSNTFGGFNNATIQFSAQIRVPIVGWSSNQALSSDYGNRVLAAGLSGGSASYTTTATQIAWSTTDHDSAGMVSGNTIVVPESGYYHVYCQVAAQTNTSPGDVNNYELQIRQDTSTVISRSRQRWYNVQNDNQIYCAVQKFLPKGAVIDAAISTSVGTGSIGGFAISNQLFLHKIQSPQTLAGGEVVRVNATTNAGQSIPNGTFTTVVFEDIDTDTHNAYNTTTGVFTAPYTGGYLVTVGLSQAANNTGTRTCRAIKNGVNVERDLFFLPPIAATQYVRTHSCQVDLLEGETLEIDYRQNSGGSLSFTTNPEDNHLSIVKIN